MMTKRHRIRKEELKDAEEPLEVMLEEKSQKSANSELLSDSSGSGADIVGKGHTAYNN